MKKYFVILGLILGCFSCSEEKVDEHILSKETMVQIMTEMELAKAIVIITSPDKKPTNEDLYHTIYQKYHTNKQNFNESLLHYAKKPQEMEQIYNEVITALSQKQAGLVK